MTTLLPLLASRIRTTPHGHRSSVRAAVHRAEPARTGRDRVDRAGVVMPGDRADVVMPGRGR